MLRPRFFRLSAGERGRGVLPDIYPVARPERFSDGHLAKLVIEEPLPFEATAWPDIMGVTTVEPDLVVSQRVIRVLESEDIQSFSTIPIDISSITSEGLRRLYIPRYSRLVIDPGMVVEVQRDYSKLHDLDEHLIPIESTWNGDELFRSFDIKIPFVLCTERLLFLAHREKWTNARFMPIDIATRAAIEFEGINYLDEWPPNRWYPPPQAEGKTPEEWLAELKSDDGATSYKATLALLESGSKVVLGLEHLLNDPNGTIRYRAANVLRGLSSRGLELPTSVLEKTMIELAGDETVSQNKRDTQ